MKKAKIICTIGPASDSEEMLECLVHQGMNVCRLNFSFGTHESHTEKIQRIRNVSERTRKPLAILLDLQGPKIRVGKLKEPITVHREDELILTGMEDHPQPTILPTTYTNIASDTEPGKTILMADGAINLEVIHTDAAKRTVTCKVIHGGTILSGKGINLPYTPISLPALTEKDKADALFGLEQGVDYIALSFVRTAADIEQLRKLMASTGKTVPIIAKIEKPEALDNLENILEVADGVMVARGDLAVEISLAKVPLAQKRIIEEANCKRKLTIIATQMLDSMIEQPTPTRAEVSDIANAILDGTDAVMLSGESATGKYPDKAVAVMRTIIEEVEQALCESNQENYVYDIPAHDTVREAICSSASHLSYAVEEQAMVVLSRTGTTGRILSKYRPDSNIFMITADLSIYNRMALCHNIYPVLVPSSFFSETMNHTELVERIASLLLEKKCIHKKDRLIMLLGDHKQEHWSTNSITVYEIP